MMVDVLLEKLTSKKVFRMDNLPNGRHYAVVGQKEAFPSITNVLGVIDKPALHKWQIRKVLEYVGDSLTRRDGKPLDDWDIIQLLSEAEAAPDAVRDSAANYGSRAHAMLESIIKGELVDVPADLQVVLDGYCQWKEQSGLVVKWVEIPVYSARHGFAGSVDAIAVRGNQLVALDWKTSNGLWPSYAMQVAAYAAAISEMTVEPVTEAWAVRLGKKRAEFEARRVKALEAAYSGFLGALALWKVLQGQVWT
jgi:hypothetical protein